jgi:hypothetical protein
VGFVRAALNPWLIIAEESNMFDRRDNRTIQGRRGDSDEEGDELYCSSASSDSISDRAC